MSRISSPAPVVRVACLDVLAPDVREETSRAAPPGFAIRFATSLDPSEQFDLVQNADFVLVGAAPVTAALIERCSRVRLIQKFGAGNPLFTLDNVVVMPHAGGGVFDNVHKVMRHAFGNMCKLLAGQALPAADVVVPPPA